MNQAFMEAASLALQELCARLGIAYAASVISNGTCWPADIARFVRRHRIRQVQISFDGLREHHDRRRRYRRGYQPAEDASSFDRAVALVDQLLAVVQVDVRLNIDRGNQGDAVPFIAFARERGWFRRPFPAVIQPARLASYSEHSAFMRRRELSLGEFEAVRARVRKAVGEDTVVEDAEAPDRFPSPRVSVCAALAHDSEVVGADGRRYRCGLQVSEPHRAVGSLPELGFLALPMLAEHADEVWWRRFDPTTLPSCSRCSFLPLCWGGCPKKHLEQDQHALAEQGAYWRRNLPRLIGAAAGTKVAAEVVFTEADQFKE